MSDKRVVVIANKRWECTPLISVLREPRACPSVYQAHPWQEPQSAISGPRPEIVNTFNGIAAEIWCLERMACRSHQHIKRSSEMEHASANPSVEANPALASLTDHCLRHSGLSVSIQLHRKRERRGTLLYP